MKKEVIIAIIVALIMAGICLGIFVVQKSKNSEIVDVKVYKHYVDKDSGNGYYSECRLTTEEQLKISKFTKKVNKLNESSKVVASINGDYKIVVNENFYAFDNSDDKLIYVGNEALIYKYNSDVYKTIIDRCN